MQLRFGFASFSIETYGIKAADSIINKSVEMVPGYRKYAVEANVPEEWILKIEDEIAERVVVLGGNL